MLGDRLLESLLSLPLRAYARKLRRSKPLRIPLQPSVSEQALIRDGLVVLRLRCVRICIRRESQLSICTSKASKLSRRSSEMASSRHAPQLSQYVYCCTSKASKLSTFPRPQHQFAHTARDVHRDADTQVFVLLYQRSE